MISWEPDKETFQEFKKRKTSRTAGMGQKKPDSAKRPNLSSLRKKLSKEQNTNVSGLTAMMVNG